MESQKRVRVALVDDSPPVRAMLRTLLEQEGCFEIVAEAGDGAELVDVIERTDPEAVVLDLAMPMFAGVGALPTLRAKAPRAKIVVLSASGRALLPDALELGADAYYGKQDPLEHVIFGLKHLFDLT